VIGTFWEYLAMIVIGIIGIICMLVAWDSRVPTNVRWSCLWYALIIMGFETWMIIVNVKFG